MTEKNANVNDFSDCYTFITIDDDREIRPDKSIIRPHANGQRSVAGLLLTSNELDN